MRSIVFAGALVVLSTGVLAQPGPISHAAPVHAYVHEMSTADNGQLLSAGLRHTKQSCDNEYNMEAARCGRLSGWLNRKVCYANAAAVYAECLATAWG